MLKATSSKAAAGSAEPGKFAYLVKDRTIPSWPLAVALTGELYRLRGDTGKAKSAYRELVLWAGSNPYGDKYGGCGIAGLALWRWVRLVDTATPEGSAEAKELLAVAPGLLNSRLVSGMFSTSSILGGFPQLEEDIRRSLAGLAWKVGMKQDAANLFFSYLKVATSAGLSKDEGELLDYLVKERGVSPERVALFRGERLFVVGQYSAAAVELAAAAKSANPQVKAEADLNQEKLRRVVQRKLCVDPEALRLLSSAMDSSSDPDLAQEALSLLSTMYVREGCAIDPQGFRNSLTRLVQQYPTGKLADDALNQLAKYYLFLYWQDGDVAKLRDSLDFYRQLSHFKGNNDFADSMRYMPAIAYYSQGGEGNLKKALASLQLLEKEQPMGQLHPQCLFWSGRIAEELKDIEGSRNYFRQVINENPLGYYAIRARMHLNLGYQARHRLDPDRKTWAELTSLTKSEGTWTGKELTGKSPYHMRLADVMPGTYQAVLKSYYDTRRQFSRKRLCDMDLKALDDANLLVPVALLLALRQDASAAADTPMESANRIDVAGCLGQLTHDWPVTMNIIFDSKSYLKGERAITRAPHYLAVAYPPAFQRLFKEAGKRFRVPPALLYSVVRNESTFSPAAWSDKGAIGLFQFLPSTFEARDKDWKLQDKNKTGSVNEYLLTPQLAVPLGARWFRELLDQNNGNVLYAIMQHNAGPDALAPWKAMWNRMGRSDDYEFVVEAVRFQETKGLVKNVLEDYWMVSALHLF